MHFQIGGAIHTPLLHTHLNFRPLDRINEGHKLTEGRVRGKKECG